MSRKIIRSALNFFLFLFLISSLLASGQQKPLTTTAQPVLANGAAPVKEPDIVLHDKLTHQVLGHAKRPVVSQSAFAAFWRTDGGFVSKMRIKNALITGPLEVAPVLYMADGTEYPMATVTVPSSGVISININQALAQAPASVMTHLSTFGSAGLRYRHASGGHLIASISMQDTSRSLVLSYPFTESPISRRQSQPTPTIWEGVWWKHDAGVQGFLAVSNGTGHEAQAKIRLISPSGALTEPKTVALKAHSTQMLSLESADGLGANGDAGGIRLEHSNEAGAIAVAGGLLNAKEGYSANIPFVQLMSSQVGPVTLGSAGIMVGKPDAMMRFPSETTFTPYLVLRNATAKSLPVTLQISYMAESAPVSKQVSENLGPQATKRVDLPNILQTLGMGDFSGSLNIGASYTGLPSDLVMASGSVDQTGNYVFEVQPQALSPTRKKLGNYWDLDAGSNTMYSLWNPTDKPQAVVVTLHYDNGNGKYKIPLRVEPQSSIMLDLKNIIESNAPDAAGNVFPANTSEGGATIESADGATGQMNLIISGAVFNVVTGTCFGCCVPCCGVSDVYLDPGSDTCSVGDTEQFQAVEEDCDGNDRYTTAGTWSSSNTGVMTVNSTGLMSAVAPGAATLHFTSKLPASSDCGEPLPGACPLTNFPAQGPVNVNDFTISPLNADVWDGNPGSFSITITGGTASSYQWSFTAPTGAGNNPMVNFSAATSAQTNTDSHWFALPDVACPQADAAGAPARLAPYTIKAAVVFQGDSQPTTHTATLNSDFVWFDVARTKLATITGVPTMAADNQNVWHITGMGTITRVLPVPNILISPTSQFYNKAFRHEQVHVDQYSPGRLAGDLYLTSVLFNQISSLTGTSQADLTSQYNQALAAFLDQQDNTYISRKTPIEHEAYLTSDPLTPPYMINNCGRF